MADQKTVEIPLVDCPIGLLTGDQERDAHYLSSMGPILATFPQVTPDSYWRLTVAEHELMLGVARGR